MQDAHKAMWAMGVISETNKEYVPGLAVGHIPGGQPVQMREETRRKWVGPWEKQHVKDRLDKKAMHVNLKFLLNDPERQHHKHVCPPSVLQREQGSVV